MDDTLLVSLSDSLAELSPIIDNINSTSAARLDAVLVISDTLQLLLLMVAFAVIFCILGAMSKFVFSK